MCFFLLLIFCFVFLVVAGRFFWLFLFCFQPKCVVNKLAFGLFVLIHVEKVLHFVEHLSLILTQAENKVANHFL